MNRLLLCPPDHYAIRYEINPWMNRDQVVDHAAACQQWAQLSGALVSLGCEMETVTPRMEWPDMVFTANAGLVQGRRILLSNYRHAERAGEQPWFERWFHDSGYDVHRVPPRLAFEGEGDALRFGDTLCCGHGFRTDPEVCEFLRGWSRCRTVGIALVDARFYHLDTCLCPLDDHCALWHPPAFDAAGREALRQLVPSLLEVPAAEAERFACNAVVLGRDVILPEGCPGTVRLLQAQGFRPRALPMGEFIKSGGACKCLVLHLR